MVYNLTIEVNSMSLDFPSRKHYIRVSSDNTMDLSFRYHTTGPS